MLRLRWTPSRTVLFAACLALGAYAVNDARDTAGIVRLSNGWWFTGSGFERRTGYSVDGRLTFTSPARVDRTLDLEGAYLVPPFGDAHNHNLGPGADARNQAMVRRYLSDGVFYVKIQGSLPITSRWPRLSSRGAHDSVDAIFTHGHLTASGGHPIPLVEHVLLPRGAFPGHTAETLKDHYYFTIDSEEALQRKWPALLSMNPAFIKICLLFSEEFERRRNDPAYDGQKALDPSLVPAIVAKAHAAQLRVSAHVATGADFHHAVTAGVDEIAHLPSVGAPIAVADAQLAATRGVVVTTTARHAVPSLIRMQVVSQADVRTTVTQNLRLLLQQRVSVVVGSDDPDDTSVKEVEYLHSLGMLDNLALLRMWSQTTPRSIFRDRQIGELREGFEASFVALAGDPLRDFRNVRRITLRFKQGVLLSDAPQ